MQMVNGTSAHQGCSTRPGGRSRCCTRAIRKKNELCQRVEDVGCLLIELQSQPGFADFERQAKQMRQRLASTRGWLPDLVEPRFRAQYLPNAQAQYGAVPLPDAARVMLLAIGLYSTDCAVVASVLQACIGCGRHIRTVAMLDRLDATDSSPRVPCGTHRVLMRSVLPAAALAAHRAGVRINFQRSVTLLKLMVAKEPQARW